MRNMLRNVAAVCSIFHSPVVLAKDFRIAALYPTGNAQAKTVGDESICMTEAVITDARQHGIALTLELIDNQRDPIATVEAAKKAAAGKYDAVVGTLNSAEALAAVKVLDGSGLPFVVPTATNPEISRGRAYVIRLAFDDTRQADLLAKFTAEELKPTRVSVVTNLSTPYSTTLSELYMSRLRSRLPSAAVTVHEVIDGFNDFTGLAGKIKDELPSVIFLPIYSMQSAKLYAELARRDVKATVLGGDGIGGRGDFFKVLGTTSANLPFVFVKHWNGVAQGSLSGEYRRIHDQYCKTYADSMMTASTFDSVYLLRELIAKDPSLRGMALVRAAKTARFDGMTGILKYGPDGEPTKPLHLFKIEGSDAAFWKTFE